MRSIQRLLSFIFTVILCHVLVTTLSAGETLDVRGVKIHYIVEGKGEPVVLIHGLYSSAAVNWQMPGIISLLSKDYQVIALDMPGHGESDKPENPDAYGLQMVEDVVQLLDHLKVKKAHIVGYSMGGMVAVKFMSKHQERVLSGIVGGMGWLREGSHLQRFWEQRPAREGSRTPAACVRGLGRLAVTKKELQARSVFQWSSWWETAIRQTGFMSRLCDKSEAIGSRSRSKVPAI